MVLPVQRRAAAPSLPTWAATHSVDLDGATMRVDVSGAEANFVHNPGFTVLAWAKRDTVAAFASHWAFGSSSTADRANGYAHSNNNLAAGIVAAPSTTVRQMTEGGGGGNTTTWRHWAFVMRAHATGGKIYRDAFEHILVTDSGAATPDIGAALDVASIGANVNAGSYSSFWAGHVLEVAFVARELTALEIAEAYNSGAPFDLRTASFAADIGDYFCASVNEGTSTVTFPNLVAGNYSDGTLINGDSADLIADVP